MESLNEKFKKFILSNFHQAGMLYGARQFLTLHLNAIGFIPSSTGDLNMVLLLTQPILKNW
jgi:hypothetical protein